VGIWVVCDCLFPHGGAERWCRNISERLAHGAESTGGWFERNRDDLSLAGSLETVVVADAGG
jgi:hypothetical protein